MRKERVRASRWLTVFGCLVLGALAGSCSSSPPTQATGTEPGPKAAATGGGAAASAKAATAPARSASGPTAGAQYVGMDTCVVCHSKQGTEYRRGTHGVGASGPNACETCHGPGSLHVAGKGDKSKIIQGKDVKR